MPPGEATVRGSFWRSATPLVLAAMLASGVLVVVLATQISFLLDDWYYILYRRDFSFDTFLIPGNEHFVGGPVATYRILLGLFGMGSTLPFRLVSTAMFLLGAWFLFVWIRRRIGQWPALIAVLPILFLGAAFDDLLWFISAVTFNGAMACGLGMLLALDRRDRGGDRLACAWLVGSFIFSSLWAAFAVGAAVDIALRRRERAWRQRAYIVLIPGAIFAIWWLGWGHTAGNAISVQNIADTPLFVLDSFGAAIASFFGLATPVEGISSPGGLDWGRPLAVLFAGLAIWRLRRIERIPPSLWVAISIVLAFWILGGVELKPGRSPWVSRYQYPGVALLLLVAVELIRGVRLERRLLGPVLVVVVAAISSNVLFLHLSYESYEETSRIERADLAAVEIARDEVDPKLILREDIAGTSYVPVKAGFYLSARNAYGSPAYSEGELERAPAAARVAADTVLAAALEIGLASPPPAAPRLLGCKTLKVDAAKPAVVTLPVGETVVRADRGSVEVRAGRFADGFPVRLGKVVSGSTGLIDIPADRSARPWRAQLSSARAVTVCDVDVDA